MNTEHPGPLLKTMFYILDQIKGMNKKFVFYWNEIRYVVEIRKYKTKRSIDQNSVLFVWLTYLENQTGHSKDDLYRIFEQKFQPYEKKDFGVFGVGYLPRPVKKENTTDFSQYLEKLRVDVMDKTGHWLPLPDEPDWPVFFESYKNK
jgi:hypothetical protein